MKKTLFVAPGKGPPYNEAWRKEIRDLAQLIGADVLSSNRSPLSVILFLSRLLLVKNRYDLFFLEVKPKLIYLKIFAKILKPEKIIFRLRTSRILNLRKEELKKLTNALEEFHLIITPSKEVKEVLSHTISQEKVKVLIPGVDLSKLTYQPPRKDSVFRLVFASAPLPHHRYPEIFIQKGVFNLIDGFLSASKEASLELHLIWRDTFLEELTNLIKTKNAANIKVISGVVDVARHLQSADAAIFVPTSLSHTPGCPYSLIESLAVGRPVILSDNLDMKEVTEKESCGTVCKPTPEAISEAIHICRLNYNRLQPNCRKTAEGYFNLQTYAREISKLLQ